LGFKFVFVIGFSLLLSCATKPVRVLNESERLRHGLTGRIYDARLCPAVQDKVTGQLRIERNCELVTCEPENGKIVCKAVKEEGPKR